MQRKLIFSGILVFLMLLFVELSSYALIYVSKPYFTEPIRTTGDIYREQSDLIRRWLERAGRVRDVIDSDLGWRYRAGHQGREDQISSQGLRSRREYTDLPAEGVLRVAAFGDSFVYGNEVVNEDAWAAIVETIYDDIEVLNYGVGGYGVDQALLRYRAEGTDLSPDVVLIGFIADDIRRIVNVYQRFYSTSWGIFTKPRFELDERGSLRLRPAPIQKLDDWRPVLDDPKSVRAWGENDQWYEPLVYENPLYDVSAFVRLASAIWVRLDERYFDPDRLFIGEQFNTSATAFKLQVAVFEAFANEVEAAGARPVILFLPSRGELQAVREGKEPSYAPILEPLRESGIDYWDATEAFLEFPEVRNMNPWFAPDGHYSPAGNLIVATWLGGRLQRLAGDADH